MSGREQHRRASPEVLLYGGRHSPRGLNAICPYYTMFPIDFPMGRLKAGRKGQWVLDPFCGRGTTNFAARLRGMSSVGIDVSPIAAAIASAKLAQASACEVTDLCERILATEEAVDCPTGDFWAACFDSKTLQGLCRIRAALIRSCTTDAEILLRALLLGILHGPRNIGAPTYLSNQMPRTYATKPKPAVAYWMKHRLSPISVDINDAVRRRASISLKDVPVRVPGKVIQADSRQVKFRSLGVTFDWVITSPPYFQMNTYVSDQWLRAWFLGGPADVDYRTDGQLGLGTIESFTQHLSVIWDEVAQACAPGAHLFVRLGCLPSSPSDPTRVLRRSVELTHAPWRLISVRPAGHAELGRRQASHMGTQTDSAADEFDLHAQLNA